jgi:hypothetical protein
MHARISEAIRLTHPLVRSTVTAFGVVSHSAGRAAARLSDRAADQGAMLVPERPVHRLEPSDRLLTRHYVHNVWRVQ